jgi:hypothetical protein
MRGALTAAGLAVAVGDLWLVVICWRSRSVLAGFLGATGIPIVLFALAGPAREHRDAAVLIAAITLVVGIGLYGLGQSIQRLLDREPDDEA